MYIIGEYVKVESKEDGVRFLMDIAIEELIKKF